MKRLAISLLSVLIVIATVPSALAITCLLCDDFEDGVLNPDWTYLKPQWQETGGSLIGSPTGRKAVAVASPYFSGCSLCSVDANMSIAGGPYNKVWLLGWYEDKKNTVELLVKQEVNKVILRQRVGGVIVSKAKAGPPLCAVDCLSIEPNVPYDYKVTYDGSKFDLQIEGVPLVTLPAVGTPFGTAGFQAKNTVLSIANVAVNTLNHAPAIDSFSATSPITVGNDSTIAGTSSDVDGDTVFWYLSIDSGSGTFTGPASGSGTISSSIRGDAGGFLVVRVSLSDGQGGNATTTATITVNP